MFVLALNRSLSYKTSIAQINFGTIPLERKLQNMAERLKSKHAQQAIDNAFHSLLLERPSAGFALMLKMRQIAFEEIPRLVTIEQIVQAFNTISEQDFAFLRTASGKTQPSVDDKTLFQKRLAIDNALIPFVLGNTPKQADKSKLEIALKPLYEAAIYYILDGGN